MKLPHPTLGRPTGCAGLELAIASTVSNDATADNDMDNSKIVDRPSQKTVDVRQGTGTGPRATVSVLFISLLLALTAGGAFLVYIMLQ